MNSHTANSILIVRDGVKRGRPDAGFTLVETSIALVIMMIVGLGAASLFAYSTTYNRAANERELCMAVAQKRFEWLRTIPFSTTNRNLAYSYPNGGLGATSTSGVVETTVSAGRSYTVTTRITDIALVPAGSPDAGQPTEKSISITVAAVGGSTLGNVTLSTRRSTLVPGTF